MAYHLDLAYFQQGRIDYHCWYMTFNMISSWLLLVLEYWLIKGLYSLKVTADQPYACSENTLAHVGELLRVGLLSRAHWAPLHCWYLLFEKIVIIEVLLMLECQLIWACCLFKLLPTNQPVACSNNTRTCMITILLSSAVDLLIVLRKGQYPPLSSRRVSRIIK